MQTSIIVTGASGFIGANLCLFLAERGRQVLAVDGPASNNWRLRAHPLIERTSLDLTIEKDVRAYLLKHRPSAVLNCAAYGAYPSQNQVDRIYAVNFHAVRHLLETLREIPECQAFVQAGSSSEYGYQCAAPAEDQSTAPDSHYAVSKVAATALVQLYGKKFKVPAWAFRLYSVYGPYEESSRLIPQLLLKASEGKLPPLVSASISRDFVYVADVCEAFFKIVEQSSTLAKGEVYNLGGGKCTTIGEIVEVVRRDFGVTEVPAWGSMPDRHWDHARWFANPGKAKRDLAWQASTSVPDGLQRTMRWMRESPAEVRASIENSILAMARGAS